MTKVKASEIKYLALEGGGGKGVAYLGAIKALEALDVLPLKITGNEPKYDPASRKITHDRSKGGSQILGISGSSAGAITAFCLALGMDSNEILEVLKMKETFYGKQMSVFNTFFDAPGIEDYLDQGIKPEVLGWSMAEKGEQLPMNHYYRTVEPTSSPRGKSQPQKRRTFSSNERPLLPEMRVRTYVLPEVDVKRLLLPAVIDRFLMPISENSIINAMLAYPTSSRDALPVLAEHKVIYHLRNLMQNGGLFTGLTVRKFFAKVMKTYLFDSKDNAKNRAIAWRLENFNASAAQSDARKISFKATANLQDDTWDIHTTIPPHLRYSIDTKPELITFRQFYYLTGVDLVITGTNLTNNIPLYFSHVRTPDFPVLEAVMLSMNLPVLFSPVHIQSNVFLDASDYEVFVQKRRGTSMTEYNNMYRGLYVDGGVLNNLPIHAFNNVDDPCSEFVDPRRRRKVYGFNKSVLALRLTDGFSDRRNENDGRVDIAGGALGIFPMLGGMLNTFMFYSEVGQIRSSEEFDHVIDCYTHHLATENFYSPRHYRDFPIMEAFLNTCVYFDLYDKNNIPRFRDLYPQFQPVPEGVDAMMMQIRQDLARLEFENNFPTIREDAYRRCKGFKNPQGAPADSHQGDQMGAHLSFLMTVLRNWQD